MLLRKNSRSVIAQKHLTFYGMCNSTIFAIYIDFISLHVAAVAAVAIATKKIVKFYKFRFACKIVGARCVA